MIASYTTEILPYNMRAKGFTVMEYALYGSLFFNQYVNPIALNNITWRYYIFYCCFLAFELVVNWFLIVETRYVTNFRLFFSGNKMTNRPVRYMPLEEITKLFDGDDVAAVANAEVEKLGEKGFSTAVEIVDKP